MRPQHVVGDDVGHIAEIIRPALEKADFVVITGGLGPTHDDITKNVTCQYFDSELIFDPETMERIRARFAERKIKMVKLNEEQAFVPEKAILIPNDCGTAPGFVFSRARKKFYVMPGVPREMKSMMTRVVIPELLNFQEGPKTKFRVLRTTGIPESTLFERLGDIAEIEKFAKLAFLPGFSGVKMRLTAQGLSDQQIIEHLSRAESLMPTCL